MKDENRTQEEINLILGQTEAGSVPIAVLPVLSAQDKRNIIIYNKLFEHVKHLNVDLQKQLIEDKEHIKLDFFTNAFRSADIEPDKLILNLQLAINAIVKFDLLNRDDHFHSITLNLLHGLGKLIEYFHPEPKDEVKEKVVEEQIIDVSDPEDIKINLEHLKKKIMDIETKRQTQQKAKEVNLLQEIDNLDKDYPVTTNITNPDPVLSIEPLDDPHVELKLDEENRVKEVVSRTKGIIKDILKDLKQEVKEADESLQPKTKEKVIAKEKELNGLIEENKPNTDDSTVQPEIIPITMKMLKTDEEIVKERKEDIESGKDTPNKLMMSSEVEKKLNVSLTDEKKDKEIPIPSKASPKETKPLFEEDYDPFDDL